MPSWGLGISSLWLKDIEMVEVTNQFLLLDVCYNSWCSFPYKPAPLARYSFHVSPPPRPYPSNIFSFSGRKPEPGFWVLSPRRLPHYICCAQGAVGIETKDTSSLCARVVHSLTEFRAFSSGAWWYITLPFHLPPKATSVRAETREEGRRAMTGPMVFDFSAYSNPIPETRDHTQA